MKAMIRLATLALTGVAMAAAQPQVATNGVVNAASDAPIGWPNSSIAQGSIFSIYGTQLGPSSSPALAYPLSTTLAGVSISIAAGSSTLNAIPIYVSPTQINAILPEATPAGSAALTVTYAGQTSGSSAFQVVASSFGIFSANSSGSGPGVITGANGGLFSINTPAYVGGSATLWGTGIGNSPGDDGAAPPQPINLSSIPLTVYVGTQQATVTYRGRSTFSGEDQINFVVPDGMVGCNVPVTVEIGEIVSNFVTMPVGAAGQSCPDPLPPASPSATGVITLTRSVTIANTTETTDSGQAFFGSPQILASPYIPPFLGNAYSLPNGACIGDATALVFWDVFGASVLDAGPTITITGPDGVQQLPASALYSGKFGSSSTGNAQSLYLNAGTYVATSPGGTDVASFSQPFAISSPLVWTNQSSISTIERSTALDVSWSGGDPDGFIQIAGVQVTGNVLIFTCNVRVSDQQFTIPPFILQTLGPSTGTSTDTLRLSATSSTPFTASGISSGTINSVVTISKNVTYR